MRTAMSVVGEGDPNWDQDMVDLEKIENKFMKVEGYDLTITTNDVPLINLNQIKEDIMPVDHSELIQEQVDEVCNFLHSNKGEISLAQFCEDLAIGMNKMDEGSSQGSFVVYIYNLENYSTLEQATADTPEGGSYSTVEITPSRIGDWKFISECIEAGSMEYSGDRRAEILYNGKCVGKFSTHNLPSDLKALIPIFDKVFVTSITSEDDNNPQQFIASTEKALYVKLLEWMDDDRLDVQYVEDQMTRWKLSRDNYPENLTDLVDDFFDNTNKNYYFMSDIEEVQLETTYQYQLEQKNK
jgi:hypothetical protein